LGWNILAEMHVLFICIGNANSMVSSEIWEKHARVSFSKTIAVVDVKSEPLYILMSRGRGRL
jgi:hypothetical protein